MSAVYYLWNTYLLTSFPSSLLWVWQSLLKLRLDPRIFSNECFHSPSNLMHYFYLTLHSYCKPLLSVNCKSLDFSCISKRIKLCTLHMARLYNVIIQFKITQLSWDFLGLTCLRSTSNNALLFEWSLVHCNLSYFLNLFFL